jgi:hypothetical protein
LERLRKGSQKRQKNARLGRTYEPLAKFPNADSHSDARRGSLAAESTL